ncbi:MAG: hypothetical protein ACJ8FU_00325 [Xanthobacteraceae bacterium]
MTKCEIEQYTKAAVDGQPWLKASAVVGSIFAAVVVVMALASSDPGPRQASAENATATTEFSASGRREEPSKVNSAHELMIRIAPYQLPVEQVDQPF